LFGIVKDLMNALPGNSSVNTVQAVFSLDSTYAPIDWLESDHVIVFTVGPCPLCGCVSKVTDFVTSYE
jgi:hypothetical protein